MWQQNNRSIVCSNRGFSLLELLVVMVIVALVTASVIVSWSGVAQDAAQESAVSRLQSLDLHMRSFARGHRDECALSFEINSGQLRKHYHIEENKNPAGESLGRGILITDLQSTSGRRQGGRIEVLFRRDGTSPTYGMCLSGPGNRKAWLLFAGMSGQVTRLKSEKEFDAALKALSSEPRL